MEPGDGSRSPHQRRGVVVRLHDQLHPGLDSQVVPGLHPAGDTQIAAYLVDPGRATYEIDDLAVESGVELIVQADDDTAPLVGAAAAIARLHGQLLDRLQEREMMSLYEEIELPLVPVLADMEQAGVQVDAYRLAEIAAKLRDQVDELEGQAHEMAGGPFTIGSPKQLGEVLFERLGLPADRKGKTGYSTDARVLAKIRDMHPIVDVVERWREQSKLLNTYLDPLPGLIDENGRLHTTFSQTTAATGRLSSIRPNLQNIPIRTEAGGRSEARSAPPPATNCCRPTTPRSSCGSSPTCRASRRSKRRSPAERTSTGRPPPRYWESTRRISRRWNETGQRR